MREEEDGKGRKKVNMRMGLIEQFWRHEGKGFGWDYVKVWGECGGGVEGRKCRMGHPKNRVEKMVNKESIIYIKEERENGQRGRFRRGRNV